MFLFGRFLFTGDVNNFANFFDIFFYVFCDLELKFELSYEELEDPVLFDFFADLEGSIYRDAGDDFDEVDHVDSVDVGVVADVGRLFGGQFVAVGL